MSKFSKRLICSLIGVGALGAVTLVLSQSVRYKPWRVSDSRRDDYDKKLAELTRQSHLRAEYSNKPRPIPAAQDRTHDFGWLHPGQAVAHDFVIRNEGDAALKLAVAETRAPGLTAFLSAEPVPPGESTKCSVRLTGKEQDSDGETVSRTVLLRTNDPLNPTLSLVVRSRVRQELVLPQKLDFGSHDLTESAAIQFDLYSQLDSRLEINDLQSEGFDVQWSVEPLDSDDRSVRGKAAVSARRMTVRLMPQDYGKYTGRLNVSYTAGDRQRKASLAFGGRVRPPIGFYGPEVDSRIGVDFGTVEAGKRHEWFVTVRSRVDPDRKIEVLDVVPKELQAELIPLKTAGAHRLRLSIPADCPDLRFNLDQQHGYVQVGDPVSESYSNWLPIYGAVADTPAE